MSSTTEETTVLPSVEGVTSTVKVIGQVKWFNKKAGYGFITVCDSDNAGKDIFVHYSSLKVVNSQYRYLVQGEYVEFNLVKLDGDKYEYHAVDVTGIKGGSIMCESIRNNFDRNPERQYRRNTRPRSNNGERKTTKKRNPEETDAAAATNDTPPGFEKVVKKRQSRNKATVS